MKIAFATVNNNIDSMLSEIFGRTNYFILYDSNTKTLNIHPNCNKNVIGAAGIQAAQFLISQDVDIVVTGYIGDNAIRFLSLAKIKIESNVTGTVSELLKQVKDNLNFDDFRNNKISINKNFGNKNKWCLDNVTPQKQEITKKKKMENN